MIIKVPNAHGGFTLYGEVDIITTSVLNKNDALEEHIDHTEDQNVPPLDERHCIKFMNKNQTEETLIISYSPVYVMNDNGRTVETI